MILQRIFIGFYKDFTNFYEFVKKMVQKNQYTYNVPPGPSANPYGVARSAEFDGTDGTGWTGGTGGRSRKVSFKFLHTLWVYRLCICLLIYEIKIVTHILMGFKISCQVVGRGQKFQNYSR